MSCAMTRPPFAFTAFRPRLPSAPVPERTTQTARAPYSRASEFNRKSKGKPRAVSRLRLRNPQRALVVGREIDARRNDIDALAFDRHSVGRLQDRHRRMAREQIHHHAVVARVEVLHDDEGHAVVRRQRVQKLPAGVKAAGRGADRDDRKIRRLLAERGFESNAIASPRWFDADDFPAFCDFSRRAALQRNDHGQISQFASNYELCSTRQVQREL